MKRSSCRGRAAALRHGEAHPYREREAIKRGAAVGEEIVFPLEPQDDFGRIAAQTAKQVVIQKVREAEKLSMMEEFGEKKGEIVSGIVQRMERGAIFVDLGRTTGIIPYEEQIPGERYRMGERIRAYLYAVDEGFRGVYLRLSRAHPRFVVKLFEQESPELAAGAIEVKALAREPGSRTKIALSSKDPHVDPVGSLVGQRGVRVSTVMGQLGGERIDIIEWNDNAKDFIKEALSPATPTEVVLDEAEHRAKVTVAEDEQSLAIGRGGQNVRLAAKLTGWNIDIVSTGGAEVAESDGESISVAEASVDQDPAEEAGVMPTQSAELIPADEPSQETTLPAEEELTPLPARMRRSPTLRGPRQGKRRISYTAPMNLLHDVDPGTKEEMNVIIEIPRGSKNKYEIDKKTGLIALDRVLHTAQDFPVDYGFVPQTLWDDGDALDVIVLTTYPLVTGLFVKARPVGIMHMIDSGEGDDKVIAVPVDDPRWKGVQDISDVNPHTLKEIEHFYTTYKQIQKKEVSVSGFDGRDAAYAAFEKGRKAYDASK